MGGPRRPRVTDSCFSDFDLELCFASKDASGEGDTSTEGAGWSGGVAGIFSLFESDELLEELEESRWDGVTNEVGVEAGVSSKLGVGGIGDGRSVSRVKDGLSPLVGDFLEDRPPMRNIDFHGLVGVDEPLRGARKLSVDLECEKTPRVCSVDVGMRDMYEGDVRELGGRGEKQNGERAGRLSGEVSKRPTIIGKLSLGLTLKSQIT